MTQGIPSSARGIWISDSIHRRILTVKTGLRHARLARRKSLQKCAVARTFQHGLAGCTLADEPVGGGAKKRRSILSLVARGIAAPGSHSHCDRTDSRLGLSTVTPARRCAACPLRVIFDREARILSRMLGLHRAMRGQNRRRFCPPYGFLVAGSAESAERVSGRQLPALPALRAARQGSSAIHPRGVTAPGPRG
jgi:hypothetical protein